MSVEATILKLAAQEGVKWRKKGADYAEVLSACYEAGLNTEEASQIAATRKMLLIAYQEYINQGLSQDEALTETFKAFFKTAGTKLGRIARKIIAANYKRWLKEIKDPKEALIRTYQSFLWSNKLQNEIQRTMQISLQKRYDKEKAKRKKEVSLESLQEEPEEFVMWFDFGRIEAFDLLKFLVAELKTHPYGKQFMSALSMYVLYGEPWEELVRDIPHRQLLSLKRKAAKLLLEV